MWRLQWQAGDSSLTSPRFFALGKVIIKDRLADAMFQELLLRPREYSVIATTNLNGDYLSDAAVMILRIDDVIASKGGGGPPMPPGGPGGMGGMDDY